MEIIIVGDGKVGHTIAQQLSRENHDVTIIENKPHVLENTINTMDVVGIVGNGTDPDTLREAKVGECDVLIAATSTDEINLICCLLAKKMGAKRTIARIRTPEYTKSTELIKDELGLSMQINPELAAAREIRRSLRFVSSIKTTSFAKGRMEMAEIKVYPDSPLVNKSVSKINASSKSKVLFCCIQRDGEIIIPNGSTVVKANDKISITGRTKELQSFFSELKIIKNKPIRDVMIVGGGRITYYLTSLLLDLNINVRIIEVNNDRCLELLETFPDATIINGDGTDHEFLLSENLEEMDAFIALTDNDEENVIVSMFANSKGVPCVLPKVNRVPLSFLLERLGMENAITPKNITANQIVQYIRAMQNTVGSNVESLIKILDDQVEVLEFRARENCQFLDKPIKDIHFKSGILAAYITHNGESSTVNGNSVVQKGDTLIIISKIKGLNDINDVLA